MNGLIFISSLIFNSSSLFLSADSDGAIFQLVSSDKYLIKTLESNIKHSFLSPIKIMFCNSNPAISNFSI